MARLPMKVSAAAPAHLAQPIQKPEVLPPPRREPAISKRASRAALRVTLSTAPTCQQYTVPLHFITVVTAAMDPRASYCIRSALNVVTVVAYTASWLRLNRRQRGAWRIRHSQVPGSYTAIYRLMQIDAGANSSKSFSTSVCQEAVFLLDLLVIPGGCVKTVDP